MKYAALLRGINVGGNNKVPMKTLIQLFESIGFTGVSTYINSGNIFFESDKGDKELIREAIAAALGSAFDFEIPLLVKSREELEAILRVIPNHWTNDDNQKTDIAYLFPEVDYPEIVSQLPFDQEYINIMYVPGALIWNLSRVNHSKSKLDKIVGSKLYKQMTVRNVNTARRLAQD